MAESTTPLKPGDVVADRYRVEALIGQGGFGAIYRATQLNIGRVVALKTLLPHALANADGRGRFRREARLAQKLEHPNTVRLYDFGETKEGLPFIAWEYLSGRSLEAAIADGPMDAGRVARIGSQVLKSLMEAHEKGIVHRDVKPANIFLCEYQGESDFVKLLDFGIAKNTKLQTLAGVVTKAGSMLGTPAYMSPEQVSGHEVTAASDLYSLGLVLAEALIGKAVYARDSQMSAAMAQLSDDPVPLPPSVLRSPLGPAIARATQKDPARRYQSAKDMLRYVDPRDSSVMVRLFAEAHAPVSVMAPTERGSSAPELRVPAALDRTAPAPFDHGIRFSNRPEERRTPAAVATPAAIPVPPSGPVQPVRRSRGRWFGLFGVLVVFAGLGYGGMRFGPRYLRHEPADPDPRPPPTADPRPADSRGMEAQRAPTHTKRAVWIQARYVRSKIDAAGYRVTKEEPAEPAPQWSIAKGPQACMVTLFHASSIAQAITYAEDQGKVAEAAVARETTAVLVVTCGDAPQAHRLLDQITK